LCNLKNLNLLKFFYRSQWVDENEASKYPNIVNLYLQQKNLVLDDTCNVMDKPKCLNKRKTSGIMTFMTTCGTCVNFNEMVTHESLTQITSSICETYKITKTIYENLIYDTACRLSVNFENKNSCVELKMLKFYIDRFHLNNHKSEKCHTLLNIDTNPKLNGYNSEACEQNFYTISKYKHIVKHMNVCHYNFFFLVLYDQINKSPLRVIDLNNKKNGAVDDVEMK
jgi:hypothetical protein